ncbi:MAG: nucleoside-diphosphate kinase [Chlamydiae bacterium]|nr:nucleoside-diphosphate kinase [Chlamydiota bacterium]MBI3277408.1 nucleoside-diphosphate kinase [Chlamydiota bacterium]
MAKELAYVLVTPYTILKSRTGGIVARLLARAEQELVAVRMFAPSQKLVEEYAALLRNQDVQDEVDIRVGRHKEVLRDLISQYVLDNFSPDPETGQRRRVIMLLFYGENAVQKIRDEVVGHITSLSISGETIRDTYGDCLIDQEGKVRYFEPAVLVIPNPKGASEQLSLWAKYSDTDGGLLEDVIQYPKGTKPEKVLVLIKPENFQRPTSRVGNIIDMFSKTGLYIISARLIQMSVAQAMEFYGPVKKILQEKLKGGVAERVQAGLQEKFDFKIPNEILEHLTNQLAPLHGSHEFDKIVKFMTGSDPSEITDSEKTKEPGLQKCLALVYQGKDAVQKIRGVLGLTDPNKAAPATVRREFGQNILVNAAHASDSVENAEREIKIVKIAENDIRPMVERFLGGKMLEGVRS